ncbi:ROK family transcriptional regulator [Alteromonas lipotrueiana]|uniref:ROK family transcriptional regulator n=1 Tax=Alteromonas lipotrueiana TaxID=2803815 RepID=UPI001C48976A
MFEPEMYTNNKFSACSSFCEQLPLSANARRALTLLRSGYAMPKADIARSLGISAQAVTKMFTQLEALELIKRGAPDKGRVGQPTVPFMLNPRGAFSLGLKVGRRSFVLSLMDLSGAIIDSYQQTFDTPQTDKLEQFVSTHLPLLYRQLSQEERTRVVGLGVAMPFEIWNWPAYTRVPAVPLENWQHYNIVGALQHLSGLPVQLCNDDTAACEAELLWGNYPEPASFVYVYIGSFAGGGIVHHGKVLYGAHHNAGALGSLSVPDPAGQPAQLLTQASLYSLEQDLNTQQWAALWDGDTHWPGLAETLNPWLQQAARALAHAGLNCQAVLDTQHLIVEGNLPEWVKEQLVAAINEQLKHLDWRGLHAIKARPGLVGGNAQVMGSANLPLASRLFLHTPGH